MTPVMPQWLTNVIELAVGLGCLGASFGAWRRRLVGPAIILVVAGIVAVIHAVVSSFRTPG